MSDRRGNAPLQGGGRVGDGQTSRASLLFVYGSLRRGFANHRHLQGATFLGDATTARPLALFVAELPYLCRTPAVTPVRGEVYAVDEELLDWVDRLEGHPYWYRRQLETVVLTESGVALPAWVYFVQAADGELSTTGDYADHVKGAHGW